MIALLLPLKLLNCKDAFQSEPFLATVWTALVNGL